MKATLALLSLAVPLHAEDWQCHNSGGCPGSITQDGELHEETFRKGDIVTDDDGWVVHPDDGWVKVRSNQGKTPNRGDSNGPYGWFEEPYVDPSSPPKPGYELPPPIGNPQGYSWEIPDPPVPIMVGPFAYNPMSRSLTPLLGY